MEKQIYFKVNGSEDVKTLKKFAKENFFDINLAVDSKKYFPVAVDFFTKKIYTINSASICALLFVNNKKELLSLKLLNA